MAESDNDISLKEYFIYLLEQLEDRIKADFLHVEKSASLQQEALEKAIIKAEFANDKRFDSVNEFRAALSDQTNKLVTRTEYSAQHQALFDREEANSKRIAAAELILSQILANSTGKSEGIGLVGSIVLSGFSILMAIGTLGSFLLLFRR